MDGNEDLSGDEQIDDQEDDNQQVGPSGNYGRSDSGSDSHGQYK